MIKKLLCFIFTFFWFFLQSQSFNLVYNFNSVTASSGSIDPTPVPTFSNVVCGAFSAVGTSSNPNATQRFTYTNWGVGASTVSATVDDYSAYTGALDTSKYYQVGLAPSAGYSLNLNAISFSMRRSGTGVRNYSVRSGLNNYANNLPAAVGTNTKLSVLANDVFFWNFDATSNSADQKGSVINLPSTFNNLGSTVNFRFYAWNAEGITGTFSIDSVVFIGSVSNTITLPTGISKLSQSLDSRINVYPNPSHQQSIQVFSEEMFTELELVNEKGERIYFLKNQSASFNASIPTQAFANGIYFIRLKTADERTMCKKIIITN